MLRYAVVEISGRQYKVLPEKDFLVDFLGEVKTYETDKILLEVNDGKIEIGSPYLKQKLKFDVLGVVRGKKLRVATYKAKANTRRVKGSRNIYSRLKLAQ